MRLNYKPHTDNFDQEGDLSSKQDTSEKGADGGYASLDASGRVPTSQLGTGTWSETTALVGREWTERSSLVPTVQSNGNALTAATKVNFQTPLRASYNPDTEAIDVTTQEDPVGTEAQSLDSAALSGAISLWQPDDSLIGATALADDLDSHAVTLSAAQTYVGERPWVSSDGLVYCSQSGTVAGAASLITQARDASCYLMFWAKIGGGVYAADRAIFSISANGAGAAYNYLFEVYVKANNLLKVFWEQGINDDVDTDLGYPAFDALAFYCIAREHNTGAGTSTTHLWINGVLVTSTAGLTNPSDGGNCTGYWLNNAHSETGTNIWLAPVIWGSGSVPTTAQVLAQYQRGIPTPVFVKAAGRPGGQTIYGGTRANESIILDPTSHADKGSVTLCPSGGAVDMSGADSVALPDGVTAAGSWTASGAASLGGSLALTGDISPASLGADQDDYNPAGGSTAAVWRLTASMAVNITGIAGGTDGRLLVVYNIGVNAITLKDENAGSSAANRLALNSDVVLAQDQCAILQYDATSSRWRSLGASVVLPLSLLNGGLGADMSSIAKGGLFVGSGSGSVGIEPVGANRKVLVADSAQTRGVAWTTATDILTSSTSAVGNIGTGEDNLITYSVPAGTLATDGDVIEIIAWGTFAANGNSKTLKLYFGATVLVSTGAVAFNAKDWVVRATVVRTGAATQEAIGQASTSDTSAPLFVDQTTPAETLSGAVTVKCTGEGTADSDIMQEGLVVRFGSPSSSVGGAMSRLAETTLGSNQTSVSFTGLDLATDQCYVLHAKVQNNAAGTVIVSLEYNSDTTTTNYYRQSLFATNTTIGGNRNNNADILSVAASSFVEAWIWINRDIGGYARAISLTNCNAASAILWQSLVHIWNATSNPTSIQLVADTANALKSGSIFRLFRVK